MDITFALPASGAALASRQVLVSVAADGRGEVALRVDVQDVWYPTRPTWSYVWKVDAVATITVWAGDGGTDPHTIVTTKPATVARLRRLVNAMPMSTGGISGCVLERGQHFSEMCIRDRSRRGSCRRSGAAPVRRRLPTPSEAGGLRARSPSSVDTGGPVAQW